MHSLIRKVHDATLKSMSQLLIVTYLSRSRAIEVGTRQVEEWGLGYIDLYLIHFPIAIQYNPEYTRVSSN